MKSKGIASKSPTNLLDFKQINRQFPMLTKEIPLVQSKSTQEPTFISLFSTLIPFISFSFHINSSLRSSFLFNFNSIQSIRYAYFILFRLFATLIAGVPPRPQVLSPLISHICLVNSHHSLASLVHVAHFQSNCVPFVSFAGLLVFFQCSLGVTNDLRFALSFLHNLFRLAIYKGGGCERQ